MDNKVYVLSENMFGEYLYSGVQSGYNMLCIKINNIEQYYYPSDVIFNKPMTNSELWNLIDKKNIPSGIIFINQQGTKILFDGTTLLPIDIKNNFICCKSDVWTLVET